MPGSLVPTPSTAWDWLTASQARASMDKATASGLCYRYAVWLRDTSYAEIATGFIF